MNKFNQRVKNPVHYTLQAFMNEMEGDINT